MLSSENPEVEIIRMLRCDPSGYTSGEALSRALGVSRTAVWKHIGSLRKKGFGIEASPSKGYKLAGAVAPYNAVEISAGLKTGTIGREIHFFDTIDSTNRKAFELARSGSPEGAAVVADQQTGGKGRLGRLWESPAGVNLYTSIILRPLIPPQSAHNLTFLAAVAVAETISRFSPARPVLKWPNDVLIGSGKVAGILMEMDSEPDRVNFIVAGIGVNLNVRTSELPGELRKTAASVCEKAGSTIDRAAFARELYSEMEKWYKIYLKEGFAPVLESWRGYFAFEGKPVRARTFKRTVEGICLGVDAVGALLIRTPSGETERIISGDVDTKG